MGAGSRSLHDALRTVPVLRQRSTGTLPQDQGCRVQNTKVRQELVHMSILCLCVCVCVRACVCEDVYVEKSLSFFALN